LLKRPKSRGIFGPKSKPSEERSLMSIPVNGEVASEVRPDHDWRSLLSSVMEHAIAYRSALPVQRVASTLNGADVLADLERRFGAVLPQTSTSARAVLEELVQCARPGLTAMAGPRFFGWVTGGTLPAALAAEWMTAAWDQNAGPAGGAPAACAFEVQAVRWIARLLDLPEHTRGALVTGGMSANFTALAAARNHVLAAAGWDVEQHGLFSAPAVQVLVGHERHDTIDKALRLLGFGKQAIVYLAADGQGRLTASALRRELAQRSGPVIVCAQAGNVNSGAFDPFLEVNAEVARYRDKHGPGAAWLHVDGAFGLWARVAPEHRALADGIELADSWATDAHKFLNVAYDCGVVLTREVPALRRAMAVHGAYLSSGASDVFENPGALTPELSRRGRGFALWAALRQLGQDGLSELVSRSCALARRLATILANEDGISIENEIVFNQVVAAFTPPAGFDRREFTHALVRAVQQEGTCYSTPTLWRGTPALRFSVVNADTSAADIERSAEAVTRVYRTLFTAAPATPHSLG
jgi:glutamate/tyrosine decarboxylase-like PLP-dependent enzyme